MDNLEVISVSEQDVDRMELHLAEDQQPTVIIRYMHIIGYLRKIHIDY